METGQKGVLTPEQVAQMQSHNPPGTPVAPAAPAAPIAPVAPIPTNTVNRPKRPPRPNIAVKQTPVVDTVIEQELVAKKEEVVEVTKSVQKDIIVKPAVNQDGETYFFFESNDNEVMEMDLITFREKGEETRYLALSIFGAEITEDPNKAPVQQYTSLTIRSKEEFEKLKKFISQLNWTD